MKKIGNIIINNILSIFTIKKFSVVIIAYIFLGLITKEFFKTKINLFSDLIEFCFYGGNNLTDMPIIVLTWIAIQIIIIYIVLDFIHNELTIRIKLIILRIKSKKFWIISIFITILIYCFLYYTLGLVILMLLNYDLIKSSFDIIYSFDILILLILSTFSVCLIGFLFTIIFKRQSIVFTLMVFFYCVAISLGKLSRYMIFSQGILIKHCYYNISFQWSYIYAILFSIVMCMILGRLLLRRDI